MEGGIEAFRSAGGATLQGKAVMSLERQVRVAAGLLVLLGVTLGFTVHPGFFGLAAFVGAGLTFAGLTDWCGMGMLLANAGLGRDVYRSLDRFLWRMRGGLAMATLGGPGGGKQGALHGAADAVGVAGGEYQFLHVPAPDIEAERGFGELEVAVEDLAQLMARQPLAPHHSIAVRE